MQRTLLKLRAKAKEVLFGSAGNVRGPIFAGELVGLFKVCQRSIALRQHEGFFVTN